MKQDKKTIELKAKFDAVYNRNVTRKEEDIKKHEEEIKFLKY